MTFYFMVVGTQDKGHKVSNVQVMPLLLGALPFEEVAQSDSSLQRLDMEGNPHIDINKKRKTNSKNQNKNQTNKNKTKQ